MENVGSAVTAEGAENCILEEIHGQRCLRYEIMKIKVKIENIDA